MLPLPTRAENTSSGSDSKPPWREPKHTRQAAALLRPACRAGCGGEGRACRNCPGPPRLPLPPPAQKHVPLRGPGVKGDRRSQPGSKGASHGQEDGEPPYPTGGQEGVRMRVGVEGSARAGLPQGRCCWSDLGQPGLRGTRWPHSFQPNVLGQKVGLLHHSLVPCAWDSPLTRPLRGPPTLQLAAPDPVHRGPASRGTLHSCPTQSQDCHTETRPSQAGVPTWRWFRNRLHQHLATSAPSHSPLALTHHGLG